MRQNSSFDLMRCIRCYNAFTSKTHRLVLHLFIPLGGVLTGLAVMLLPGRETKLPGFLPGISMLAMSLFLTIYEVMMDGKVFGGLMRKGESRMDLLKTSSRGVSLFRDALTADQIIRLCTHFLVCGICTLLTLFLTKRDACELVSEWMLFSAATYLVAQAGILLCRLIIADAQIVTALVMVAATIMSAGVVMVQDSGIRYRTWSPLIAFFCVIFGALAGIWMVKAGVQKKKEEYHDT